MDLEWAMGKDGLLYWLQARPITRLGADPNELDTMQDPGDIYTSCNIGECMPGAITPLTFSTVWHADDQALQLIHVRSGVAREVVDGFLHSRLYYGRMFINLTKLGRVCHPRGGRQQRADGAGPVRPGHPRAGPGPRWLPAGAAVQRPALRLNLLSGGRHKRKLEKLAAAAELSRGRDRGGHVRGHLRAHERHVRGLSTITWCRRRARDRWSPRSCRSWPREARSPRAITPRWRRCWRGRAT